MNGVWTRAGLAAATLILMGCGAAAEQASVDAAEGSSAGAVSTMEAPADPAAMVDSIPLAGTETDEDWQILLSTVSWAREQGLDTLPMGETVAGVGRRFVGRPYTPGTLEVADPEALVVNLREFDCVTFVENAVAISRVLHGEPASADPERLRERFVVELAGLRYRDGRVDGYPSRLHYFSEWIKDNERRNHVQQVSTLLGATADEQPITFMTTHAEAYRQLADSAVFQEIRRQEEDISSRPRYEIRENRIAQFADGIQTGDVIAATSTLEGLDVAHTGIAIWDDGVLRLMHAPLVGDSVQISEVPLAERIQRISRQDGIMVARPLAPARSGS